jgi:hypothetical protein
MSAIGGQAEMPKPSRHVTAMSEGKQAKKLFASVAEE